MKTLFNRPVCADRIRQLCLIAAALLFLCSTSVLLLGIGADISLWRGLALSSLYLSFCLTQRRLFVSSSRPLARYDRHGRTIE